MKKYLFGITGALLMVIAPLNVVHSATVPDEQWNLPMNGPGQDGAELIGIKIAGAATGLNSPSYIAGDSSGTGDRTKMLVCASENDSICGPAARIEYEAYLPPCNSQIAINCISGVSAIDVDGKEIQGKYSQNFPIKVPSDYVGDPSRNLPTGSDPSVWKIPGVVNGGGTENYLLRFLVRGDAKAGAKFYSNSVDVALYPVTTKSGNYSTGNMTDANHPSGGCTADHFQCGQIGFEHSGDDQALSAACVSFDVGLCALRQAFPSGYRFKVSAKLGNSPTGWFHGRFYSPKITLDSSGDVANLTVDASPVNVPAIGTYIKQSAMPEAMKQYYSTHRPGGAFGRLSANGISNLISLPTPSDPNIFTEYALWSPILQDKASATQSEWSFRTLELNGQNDACFRDSTKLVGVVSTNAMMYSGGAPEFNKAEGTLDYKVGAPHFASNGDVFKGSYDLQLRSDVARCLYKFSNAPIKATVSIASDNGDSNVATTIVSEDKETGWLRMSASNFMFSNPTVKIKFSQDAQAPAPSASPTPSSSPSASSTTTAPTSTAKTPSKSTIVCVKGKLSKTISGVKPTCPIGYKKK